MSPRGDLGSSAKVDPNDVLLELAITFGQAIKAEDCTFDDRAVAVFKKIFAATVGRGLEKDPDIWKEPGRSYVHKVVEKIATCACNASEDNRRVINGDILENCALERIAIERQLCGYAAEHKEERGLEWSRISWGDFCPE